MDAEPGEGVLQQAAVVYRTELVDEEVEVWETRIALANQLFQEGVISVGKAAEMAGKPR